jgi:hypothetical protein
LPCVAVRAAAVSAETIVPLTRRVMLIDNTDG